MGDRYSVVYDPIAKVPFGIIKQNANTTVAYAVHKSANHWANSYNNGERVTPHGMTSSEFTEMDSDFVKSFKLAFSGADRVARRAHMLINSSVKYTPTDLVYGVGFMANARRDINVERKVLPIIEHNQREIFRANAITQAIRTGKRWLRQEKA